MMQPSRKYSAGDGYRYGFNGKENDNEAKGEGNQQDYGMRIYDPRLGRFLSVDPLTKEYPWLTPYQFASNTPIQASDLDGAEADFSKGKMTVMEYGNNPLTWLGTFGNNVTAYCWNTVVDGAETSVNVFSKKGREKINQQAAQFQINTFFYIGGTSAEQKLEDLKDFATDPHTYESLIADYAIAKGTSAGMRSIFIKNITNPKPKLSNAEIEKIKSWINQNSSSGAKLETPQSQALVYPDIKAPEIINTIGKRFAGLRDRNTQFEIKVFGSAVKGAPNPNDLDVLILTNSKSQFGADTRIGKIIRTIMDDFKQKSGKELDVNVMTKEEYMRAKGGEFKKDVDKTSKNF